VQRRRRRIDPPGSDTRESMTWVSVLPQNGHFIAQCPHGRPKGTESPPRGEANAVSFGGAPTRPRGRPKGTERPPWGEANAASFGGGSTQP
jgi:hypothetical protein